MKYPIFLASLFFIGSILGLSSCVTSENESAQQEEVVGNWELKEAYREGKKTVTLEGYYFNFKENGQVTTNFNEDGTEKTLQYEMNEAGQIDLKGGGSDFKAEMDLDGHLILKTSLANNDFKLVMQRKTPTTDDSE